ncbi:hypothetical protein AKJ48_03675 [candidate division MSBL1 archaeon SCGC-AAA261O19]|uniref:AAA+ ATPase domain-containing protein n=1 Tax=candidate division MSBL1 archaeon SCGC-AAA261O19 TaxID=1698277 RepID=A0A133VBA3_9EURY|nr:hypothetical protein AKJ48_03675 [candidate division MSBL1 archaeon SCGC-AAA261O19]
MEREEIIEEMYSQNPWWRSEPVKLPDKAVERNLMPQILEDLKSERVTTIVGLRRVGKTTLLKLIIEELSKELERERICYFSFDLAEQIQPREIVKIYSEEIIRKTLPELEERVYFFFDEIQKVKDWGNQVKSIQDKGYNIKFVATGSSSINITKGIGESLAGRTLVRRLRPFSFPEFLMYRNVDFERGELEEPIYPDNSEKLRILFNEYMEAGGLPELYEEMSLELLKQILDLVFFRDIVNLFPVKRTDVLKGIFRILVENTAQKVNYTKFARDLDTQYRTVKEYLQYLEDSFLIQRSHPYEGRRLKRYRKNPKIYVADHAYTNLWKCEEGLKAETIAFNHLKRIEKPFHLKDPEIDIVLPENKCAIEVKYKPEVRKSDAKPLTKLSNDFKLFLVTKENYGTWNINGRDVQLIPLWLLCTSTS